MSFCADIKKDISQSVYKNSCCRRALLCAMLFAKGTSVDGSTELSLSDKNASELSFHLIKEFYSVEPEVSGAENGGRRRLVRFKSKSASALISNLDIGKTHISSFIKCPSCQSAVLRGLFLAAGTISDPERQFCLEFSPSFRFEAFSELLNLFGLSFLESSRKQNGQAKKVLYTKRQNVIEDFFGMAGLEQVTYDVINSGIQKDFNNRINRLRNVEIVNIVRTVERSKEQREIIEELISHKLLTSFPDELAYTARLRLENPDAPLAVLASYHTPPITKSGLSHRLSRIMKLGRELLEKHKK